MHLNYCQKATHYFDLLDKKVNQVGPCPHPQSFISQSLYFLIFPMHALCHSNFPASNFPFNFNCYATGYDQNWACFPKKVFEIKIMRLLELTILSGKRLNDSFMAMCHFDASKNVIFFISNKGFVELGGGVGDALV